MLENELKEIEDNKESHWLFKLIDYPEHPLKELLLSFGNDSKKLFQSSYLFLGEIPSIRDRNNKIGILHFHSSLNGPMKFMDMQNLDSYRYMWGLREKDIFYLSGKIIRSNLIDLSHDDALTKWHLDWIYRSRYFYIADETGFAQECSWQR